MNASFRFLIITAAIALWVGAVATAGEPVAFGERQLSSVSAALWAGGERAMARAAGGEAPVETSESNSGD